MKFDDVDAVVSHTKFMKTRQGRTVYQFIIENRLSRVLELGFAHGKSTCYLAAAVDELGADGHVVAMDVESAREREPNIHDLLAQTGLTERVTPVFARTSYTWELMKMLEQEPRPRFDFAYIDGGHTWDVSGFGFMLVDRLLAPGGWVLFDDLDWTIASSPSVAEAGWARRLPEEARTTPQVRKVFELLVRTHPGYVEFRDSDGWGWARKAPDSSPDP